MSLHIDLDIIRLGEGQTYLDLQMSGLASIIHH